MKASNTKVIYRTTEGRIFKTFTPADYISFMTANYDSIEIISAKPSIKGGYKKYSNIPL